eukprot:TRINITY_DN4847_c0_g1_i1.p1 TRINITY_DN4847_c0_g1~~TRINITY_DN4847_c0_g1_i1.p1  ORF type:complete len:165 (-),score=24.60 TRINITY_DN4847_c0_g1_i1:154-648(-)
MYLPIVPIKGYSLTAFVDKNNQDIIPDMNISDQNTHIFAAKMDDRFRVVGMGEIGEYDAGVSFQHEGLKWLLRNAQLQFPGVFDDFEAQVSAGKGFIWACLRPFCVYSIRSIIGETKISGLFVNNGHGTRGWTLGTGSGSILADLITNKQPEINAAPFSPNRFC